MQKPQDPRYDPTEHLADRVVHLVGIFGALGGLLWLIANLPPGASPTLTVSVWIYGLGLLGMWTASALYNAASPGPVKSKLRRLDHAMIFVMIAASYTPFSLNAFPAFSGHLLFGIVWFTAIAGVLLKVFFTPRSGFFSTGLYIAMGCIILVFLPTLIASVPGQSLLLLALGGAIYSIGGLIHAWGGVRFHNVIWHLMVLLGAALHFGAIAQIV